MKNIKQIKRLIVRFNKKSINRSEVLLSISVYKEYDIGMEIILWNRAGNTKTDPDIIYIHNKSYYVVFNLTSTDTASIIVCPKTCEDQKFQISFKNNSSRLFVL